MSEKHNRRKFGMIGTWKLDSTFDGLGPGSLDLQSNRGVGIGLLLNNTVFSKPKLPTLKSDVS